MAMRGIRDTGCVRLVFGCVQGRCYTTPSTSSKAWENRKMSDVQKLIAGVMAEHQFSWGIGGTSCSGKGCRDWRGYPVQHRQHLAAEIDKALGGLTQEMRTNPMSSSGMTTNYNTGEVTSYSDIRRDQRWVSDWSEA